MSFREKAEEQGLYMPVLGARGRRKLRVWSVSGDLPAGDEDIKADASHAYHSLLLVHFSCDLMAWVHLEVDSKT